MKTLIIIPARGGSKRLPNKNIKYLGDKPLIEWSIETAKKITPASDILISTDSEEIAEVARSAGCLVPWLRPAELANDTANSIDVCLHALSWYENHVSKVDGILLLQPTSPFRDLETVLSGVEMFKKGSESIVGVSSAKSHPFHTFKVEKGTLFPFIAQENIHVRSQDLPLAYQLNGAFYLIKAELLKKEKTFLTQHTQALIFNHPSSSIDIDTQEDWDLAEYYLSRMIK